MALRRAGRDGTITGLGAWRSLVARLNGVQKVGGSNPLAPTRVIRPSRSHPWKAFSFPCTNYVLQRCSERLRLRIEGVRQQRECLGPLIGAHVPVDLHG